MPLIEISVVPHRALVTGRFAGMNDRPVFALPREKLSPGRLDPLARPASGTGVITGDEDAFMDFDQKSVLNSEISTTARPRAAGAGTPAKPKTSNSAKANSEDFGRERLLAENQLL